MTDSIKLVDLKKQYGDTLVLDIPQLEIECGRVIGLLGENGAGKSTLIDLIGRVTSPSCGSVFTGNSRIGWCSQRLVIDWFVSGWMNVWLGACLSGKSGSEARSVTEQAIALVGLDHTDLSATPEVLSGGQQQRLMIARTFAMKPDIYLLDEPTVGLDLTNLERFSNHIRDVKDSGATVIISSHEFEAVEDLIDDVIFLSHGCVKFFGRKSEFTDRFITEDLFRLKVDRAVSPDELKPLPGVTIETRTRELLVSAPRGSDFSLILQCLPEGIGLLEYSRQPISLRHAVKLASQ